MTKNGKENSGERQTHKERPASRRTTDAGLE